MKVAISVPELVSIFKEIQEQHEQIYDMIRADMRALNICFFLSF